MSYKTVYTEVEVDLDDFSDEELLEELQSRKAYSYSLGNTSLQQLYETWISNRDQFEDKFRDYCRENLGRSF